MTLVEKGPYDNLVQCERCGRVYAKLDPPPWPHVRLGLPLNGGAFTDESLPPCCQEGHFRAVVVEPVTDAA